MKKTIVILSLFVLIGLGVYLAPVPKGHAQQGGVATVVGGITPVNQFAQSVAGGLAGAVTNPASNFVVQVAGGPVYFGGGIQDIAQAQLTLPANSTNLIVWNGFQQIMYSKQAVTGPGSLGTNAINGPGIPTTLLFADPQRGEIPLATVVCNGTACGNGGNGTITDNRPLAAFPAGQYVGGHLNSTTAGTTAAMAFQGSCTLAANTCTMTFTQAFQSAPVCVATDQTTPQLVKAPATTASVVVTDTVGATDVVSVICVGNPN
jgi:hypothetical protein